MTKSKFIKKTIALSIGLLMNPILLVIVYLVDSPTSNEWLQGKALLERTPFSYTYFWSSVFLPGNPPNFSVAMLAAIISNTILYSVLIYTVLNCLWNEKIKLR
jgi:hypothetical protein